MKEQKEMPVEDTEVVDAGFDEDEPIPAEYQITSYGADYTVDGLVKRLSEWDIEVPPFQRGYV